MPEEIEIETTELQETLHELQEERRERVEEERKTSWTRYIALTTAILAVFAAIGALQSGSLVNEAMMKQLRASDTWNEYQASRGKDHLYTIQAQAFLDRGVTPPPPEEKPTSEKMAGEEARAKPARKGGAKAEEGKTKEKERVWRALPPEQRLAAYLGQVKKEDDKEKDLQDKAKELEEESERLMRLHEQFAQAVALIQVAIALSAVAALTRIKLIWLLGSAAGLLGIVLFALGFVHGH